MSDYLSNRFGPFPAEISTSLESAINSFCNITQVPVTFFDQDNEIKWECNSKNKICNFFSIYQKPEGICRKNLQSATNTCRKLREPYVFVCPAGFIKIVVTLIVGEKHIGSLIAGPIVMGSLKESTVSKLFQLNDIAPETYPKLLSTLRHMKTYDPKDVASLQILLGSCVTASIKENNTTPSTVKITKINGEAPELDNSFIGKIRNGDFNSAEEVLLFLLQEASILESEDDSYDIAHMMRKVMDSLGSNLNGDRYSGNSKVVSRAVKTLNENYMNKLTLCDVSRELSVNQSYLSALFKKETGESFTDYLNGIRIERSKYLLSRTHLSLVDIAANTGFEDQSYFTKVFKKKVGATPTQFRRTEKEKKMGENKIQNV